MDGAIINSAHLLSQLEAILDADPDIDEVGYVHPSQFAALSEMTCNPSTSKPPDSCNSSPFFWNNKHKLGISTAILVPLYGATKDAFMNAFRRYKMLCVSHELNDGSLDAKEMKLSKSDIDYLETDVMKHSRTLLLLSCDFGSAWNSRKTVLLKKHHFPMLIDELHLSTLVLSYAPKSERAWSHRRWVIKTIGANSTSMQEIVERESELVKKLAENSKMNYRAWNHRCWLVSYMSRAQVLHELRNSRDWSGLHVADNSSFHYRTRLLLWLVDDMRDNQHPDAISGAGFDKLWKEELDWVELMIRRYVGREALWLHRRFLSLSWIRHLISSDQTKSYNSLCKSSERGDISMFIDDELKLVHSCTIIFNNEFEDYEAQSMYSATYIIWLAKQMPMPFRIQLENNSQYEALQPLIRKNGKGFLGDTFNEL